MIIGGKVATIRKADLLIIGDNTVLSILKNCYDILLTSPTIRNEEMQAWGYMCMIPRFMEIKYRSNICHRKSAIQSGINGHRAVSFAF